MNNELLQIELPAEVKELSVRVSNDKQIEVRSVLNQIFSGTDDWSKQVDEIEVKGVDDKMSIELAEVARKNLKKARLNAEKIIDAKRIEVQNLKAEYDVEDKLWLKAKQVMQIKFKAIEEKAEWKANYAKRFKAEQKELETQKRINQVSKYSEINRIEFQDMSFENFEIFIKGLKNSHDERVEFERQEKEEIRLKEVARLKEIEDQRIENLRLKKEAEKREAEIQKEREQNKKKLEEERKETEKREELNKAKLKKEQDAKLKLEAELKIKIDLENKVLADLKAKELKDKKEAKNKAKSPIKKQLNTWVDSFSISEIDINTPKKILIKEKFEAFKSWAKNQVDSI